MSARYFCVDDQPRARNAYADALEAAGIGLVYKSRTTPAELVTSVVGQKFDGVLLDFVLEFHQVGEFSNTYAQALRDAAAFRDVPDLPIVLWSSMQKFRRYYSSEPNAADLYDYRFDKNSLARDDEDVVAKLESLPLGYRVIEAHRSEGRAGLVRMLALPRRSRESFDIRIGARFDRRSPARAHEYARYIMRELIQEPRPLVNEHLLAARLGLDLRIVGAGWARVLAAVANCSYAGAFSEGWPRWWWHLVETWWREEISTESLVDLPAADRVRAINSRLRTRLRAAEPLRGCRDTRYWAICEVAAAPVAISEALESTRSSSLAWHDARFVSIPKSTTANVSPTERNRLVISGGQSHSS